MLTIDRSDELIQIAGEATSREAFVEAVGPLVEEFGTMSFGIGRGSIYWRARKIETKRYDLLAALDYKPANLVLEPGRLNDAGESCFYLASTIETALAEVHADEGGLVQIAGYRLKPDAMLRLVLLGEYYSVYKRGYTLFNGTDPGGTIQKLLNDDPPESRQSHLVIDHFLATVMSDPKAREEAYMKTRALRDLLYQKNQEVDCIGYPSVRDPGGFNLGVKAEGSDDLFTNVACIVVEQGKRRSVPPHDTRFVAVAEELDSTREYFVWAAGSDPTSIVIYNATRDEYLKHSKPPFKSRRTRIS